MVKGQFWLHVLRTARASYKLMLAEPRYQPKATIREYVEGAFDAVSEYHQGRPCQ